MKLYFVDFFFKLKWCYWKDTENHGSQTEVTNASSQNCKQSGPTEKEATVLQ